MAATVRDIIDEAQSTELQDDDGSHKDIKKGAGRCRANREGWYGRVTTGRDYVSMSKNRMGCLCM